MCRHKQHRTAHQRKYVLTDQHPEHLANLHTAATTNICTTNDQTRNKQQPSTTDTTPIKQQHTKQPKQNNRTVQRYTRGKKMPEKDEKTKTSSEQKTVQLIGRKDLNICREKLNELKRKQKNQEDRLKVKRERPSKLDKLAELLITNINQEVTLNDASQDSKLSNEKFYQQTVKTYFVIIATNFIIFYTAIKKEQKY